MIRGLLSWLAMALRLAPRDWASVAHMAAPSTELNTILFYSTFRIEGPRRDHPEQRYFGTVFVIGAAADASEDVGPAVLVTAAHVLEHIGGDEASLLMRRPKPDGGYEAYPFAIRIREMGRPLYVRHATADVAVMHVAIPGDVPITGLALDFLVDDARLKSIQMHPGDEIFCLGFPLAAAGPGGFPFLRRASIASYPLTPLTIVRQIEVDIALLPGSSGGPAYYCYERRLYENRRHAPARGLLGLIVRGDHTAFGESQLNFSVIVPAPFIRETMNALRQRSPGGGML